MLFCLQRDEAGDRPMSDEEFHDSQQDLDETEENGVSDPKDNIVDSLIDYMGTLVPGE